MREIVIVMMPLTATTESIFKTFRKDVELKMAIDKYKNDSNIDVIEQWENIIIATDGVHIALFEDELELAQ